MKKILAVIMLVLFLAMSSCNKNAKRPDDYSSSSEQSSQSSETDLESSSEQSENSESSESQSESSSDDNPDEDMLYKQIERYMPSDYSSEYFAFDDSEYVVTLKAPIEWSFTKNADKTYVIKRNGSEIGKIMKGETSDTSDWKNVFSRVVTVSGITVNEYVEKQGTGETLTFRYRWRYSYTENEETFLFTVIAAVEEVHSVTSYRMASLANLSRLYTDPNYGILSELENASICILGNSFVRTSNVGEILTEMIDKNGKNVTVTAISIGMASLNTFVNDTQIMDDIRNGKYDAVFTCGFYSGSESERLSKMKAACEESGTVLVGFPAYNESLTGAEYACSYCSVPCLSWKRELEALISSGVDKWDLCINDSYEHSTPIAGYVGASMIYRAIYGENPSASLGDSISQYEINSVLGSYVTKGYTPTVKLSKVHYLG